LAGTVPRVDMTLSKRGDYAVRSAIALARRYTAGDYYKVRQVIAEMQVPATYASQILADLIRAGLAVSRAGKSGGYRLTRSPDDITVLDIIEAAEGPLRAERCALGEGPCRWESVCPLHDTWISATDSLRETLSLVTLSALARQDALLETGTASIPSTSHRLSGRRI
jgi:Rrf2 family protein